ncbi:MAG: hypothetical protein RL756_2091 [Pseudomonadota bacterium]|jgi:hypothetical protein
MTTVGWESFAADVERLFPEITPRLALIRPLWESEPIPAHIVLGDVVVPALIGALDQRDSGLVARFSELLTSLAESADDRLSELVMVSFIEFVIGDRQLEARLQPHLSAPLLSLVKQRRSWKPGNHVGFRP